MARVGRAAPATVSSGPARPPRRQQPRPAARARRGPRQASPPPLRGASAASAPAPPTPGPYLAGGGGAVRGARPRAALPPRLLGVRELDSGSARGAEAREEAEEAERTRSGEGARGPRAGRGRLEAGTGPAALPQGGAEV